MVDFFISFEQKPELIELFKMFFGYVTKKSELNADEIIDKIQKSTSESLNSKIMSTYDSIIAKGKAQGISQGEINSKIIGVRKALNRKKLTIEEIAEDFEVSLEFVLKIKKEHNL